MRIFFSDNFQPGPGQSAADVVFSEGISTASSLSLTSGRGVGLSAVRRVTLQNSGDAHILDRTDQPGCDLLVTLASG